MCSLGFMYVWSWHCASFDGFEARVALQTRQHLEGVVMLSNGNEEPGDAIDGSELSHTFCENEKGEDVHVVSMNVMIVRANKDRCIPIHSECRQTVCGVAVIAMKRIETVVEC